MFMPGDTNTETNQTPKTIHLPDESQGVENFPSPGQPPAQPAPDEHVPPVEVPGRPETPEHVPEKGKRTRNKYPALIKG